MIRLAAFTGHEDGWGRQSRALAKELARHEPTELVDLERGRPAPLPLWRRLQPSFRKSVGIVLGAVEQTFALPARYRVAYYVGETTRIHATALYFLRRADMVWTPSHWGRRILEAHDVPRERIGVAPEGVDSAVFVPSPDDRRGEIFRFLCVAKWEERKGAADLVRAFRDEFRPGEPVELAMHCGPAASTAAAVRDALAGGSPGDAPRIVCTDPVSLAGLVALMQSCHAFVLPTRAEGWGLPILEAMACGLPCIVTGYSGLTEFAHEENCFLIRVAGMCRVRDPRYYAEDRDSGEWAQPDLAHLRALMRLVYENRMLAAAKAKRAREEAVRLWGWDRAAQAALAHIRDLRGGRLG
jgi:glycosyltransferase involved in cell wall biosynthesis